MSQESRTFNEALVGRGGSRLLLDAPALVLDLDAFTWNLETMQALLAAGVCGTHDRWP